MEIDQNQFLTGIFNTINELFANEIGPVANFLCDEVKAEWEDELQKRGLRPGLRNIPIYVNKLSRHIEDEENRQIFLDSAFQIDALALFKES